MTGKTLLSQFDIGDLVQGGFTEDPTVGIVVALQKQNHQTVEVAIKWTKRGETRTLRYSPGHNGWWLKRIKILAKAA